MRAVAVLLSLVAQLRYLVYVQVARLSFVCLLYRSFQNSSTLYLTDTLRYTAKESLKITTCISTVVAKAPVVTELTTTVKFTTTVDLLMSTRTIKQTKLQLQTSTVTKTKTTTSTKVVPITTNGRAETSNLLKRSNSLSKDCCR